MQIFCKYLYSLVCYYVQLLNHLVSLYIFQHAFVSAATCIDACFVTNVHASGAYNETVRWSAFSGLQTRHFIISSVFHFLYPKVSQYSMTTEHAQSSVGFLCLFVCVCACSRSSPQVSFVLPLQSS